MVGAVLCLDASHPNMSNGFRDFNPSVRAQPVGFTGGRASSDVGSWKRKRCFSTTELVPGSCSNRNCTAWCVRPNILKLAAASRWFSEINTNEVWILYLYPHKYGIRLRNGVKPGREMLVTGYAKGGKLCFNLVPWTISKMCPQTALTSLERKRTVSLHLTS